MSCNWIKIVSATIDIFLAYYRHLTLCVFASIALQNFDQTVQLLMLYVVEGNPLLVAMSFAKRCNSVRVITRMDQNAAIIGKFTFDKDDDREFLR